MFERIKQYLFLYQRQLLAGFTFCLVLFNWTTLLSRSLWIDELLTFAAVNSSLSHTISTTLTSYYQSPLYFVIVWCGIQLFGHSEVVMRLPSLFGVIFAAYGLYYVAKYFMDKEHALYAVILFVCHEQVTAAALNARPYGVALAIVVFALLSLVCWTQHGSKSDFVFFISTTSLIVYIQPTFTPVLIMEVVYFAMADNKSVNATWKKLWMALACAGVVDFPLVFRLISIWGERSRISFVPTPTLEDFFLRMLHHLPLVGILALCALTSTYWLIRWSRTNQSADWWGYILVCSAMVYAFPFSGTIFWFHLLFLAANIGKCPNITWDKLSILLLFFLIAGLPLIADISGVWAQTKFLLRSRDKVSELHWQFLRQGKLAALLLGLMAGGFINHLNKRSFPAWSRRLTILIFWTAVLPVLLFGISLTTDAKIFFDRYYLAYAIGLALLMAKSLTLFDSKLVKTLFVIATVLGFVVNLHTIDEIYLNQNWATAAKFINRVIPKNKTIILLDSGFIESKQLVWLRDSERSRHLRAPLEYYPVRGSVCLLPMEIQTPQTADYVRGVVTRLKASRQPFILATIIWKPDLLEWLKKQVDLTHKLGGVRKFGTVTVAYFGTVENPPVKPAL